MNRTKLTATIALLLTVSGCVLSIQDSAPAAQTNALPISYNDVMVALVNEAADPIWVAAWHNPDSEKAWRDLERRAYQLELAGVLLEMPGEGPLDRQWANNPEWRTWSKQLRTTGEIALAAVRSRNLAEISRAGDMIVEVCEGCHRAFKLGAPTGGKYGELSPTAEDLQ